MKKRIKVTTITNNEKDCYETNCIIIDNYITYIEKDKTKTKYDYKENKLIRLNNNINMNYKFDLKNKSNGNIYINELNRNVNVIIRTKKIIINNYNICIKFMVEDVNIEYKVEVLE